MANMEVANNNNDDDNNNNNMMDQERGDLVKPLRKMKSKRQHSYRNSMSFIIKKKQRSRRGSSRASDILSINHDDKNQPLLSSNLEHSEKEKEPLCNFSEDLKGYKKLIFGSWLNLLLFLVPAAFAVGIGKWNDTLTFFICFLAMIPLASILGDATECLADHLGETVGGLLNATFGNAVEIVVMVLALIKAKSYSDPAQQETLLIVVQTSLIGSIFSNALLVLGCAFFANGIYYKESKFNVTATTANTSLLMISAFVMILPGPYGEAGTGGEHDVLMISRAAAIILMLMYIALLIFVLFTHKDIMNPEDMENDEIDSNNIPLEELEPNSDPQDDSDDEDEDEVELSLIGSCVLLFISTILVAVLSEFLVGSIEPMASAIGMKSSFVGIILLPIIGNAVEHVTAIRMALRNKMDIALSIAIGSATQVAMFVVSLAVIVGWCLDLPLSLAFDPFETNLFIYSSIIIFAIIADGSSNWLEGIMLLALYILVGIAVWDQEYNYSPKLT